MARSSWLAGTAMAVAIVVAAGVAVASVVLLTSEDDRRSPMITNSAHGSGSTAQKGAMEAWRADFERTHPGLRVTYEANGSGAGIRDFIAGRSAFAGSDVPMDAQEQALADRRCGDRAVHLPMVIGPIALVYNVASVPDLKLSPATLTGIFSGRITTWNDARIAADNHGTRLPGTAIRAFHRSDDSGTTYNFLSYLEAAGRWPHQPSRKWTGPGLGVVGSAGMTQAVQHSEDSIGYVEYGFASSARLKVAKLRNAAGQFVALSPGSATKTLRGAQNTGREGDVVVRLDYLTETPGAYPLVLATYEIICARDTDPVVRTFLNYTSSDAGQSYLAINGYAPLPYDLLAQVRARLGAMS
ncbi:phosphate ABC transporter substrate-binding protein PstS [Nonomuraea sp. MG754425]|uniref:phosphate ABC transporter substrate-binding protein PstS n=1 Tax=Nonomuraea sp. MG754425 TaxID=2570319 RepID=UPI001F02E7F2|nr:phosphate ABC transporter substrate-binding protein PstS [Nonomuraea sp. MG754425]MCF6470429.1 phosphate ABC transporter substrate-binding protein PstS [Nonomuraea sp. MG754425]